MNNTYHLPFCHETADYRFQITDLPLNHPAALQGWPEATLALQQNLKGDDTFVKTLLSIISIGSQTIRSNSDRTQYTFLVHPNLRTSAQYTPAHLAGDVDMFVNLLKKRTLWRKTNSGKAFVGSTRRGVFVTLRGFTNIEDARNALKEAAPQGVDHLFIVSAEDYTFKTISRYKDEINVYFN